jgi:hypothetical protein
MVDESDPVAMGDVIADSISDVEPTVDAFDTGFSDAQVGMTPRGSEGNPLPEVPFTEDQAYGSGYVTGTQDFNPPAVSDGEIRAPTPEDLARQAEAEKQLEDLKHDLRVATGQEGEDPHGHEDDQTPGRPVDEQTTEQPLE